VDHLRLEQCELPSFSMLDRLVNRVRTLVHRRVFAQVMRKLGPPEVARLDELLKCRAALINENCIIIVARHNRSFSLDSICGNAHCVPVSFCCDMPRQSLSPDNRF
jgi:hypothetical protein